MQLGHAGELVVTCGSKSIAFANASMKAGTWAHVTLYLDNEEVRLLVNNTGEQSAALATPFTAPADEALLLGGGFVGRIDEVRVWDGILADDYNRFWNNTIDHLCRIVASWRWTTFSRLAAMCAF